MFQPARVCIYSIALLTVTAIAQSPDIPEPGPVAAIAAATTDPHFVSPWVSYVPQSNTVPSPEKFIGRIMGAPGGTVRHRKNIRVCGRSGCRQLPSSRIQDWAQ
jgi:hypothetical protein